jgi:hypothetical protein
MESLSSSFSYASHVARSIRLVKQALLTLLHPPTASYPASSQLMAVADSIRHIVLVQMNSIKDEIPLLLQLTLYLSSEILSPIIQSLPQLSLNAMTQAMNSDRIIDQETSSSCISLLEMLFHTLQAVTDLKIQAATSILYAHLIPIINRMIKTELSSLLNTTPLISSAKKEASWIACSILSMMASRDSQTSFLSTTGLSLLMT